MANDLDYIKNKVDNHDKMMIRIVELNERQVASNDKLNDHIIRTDKRLDNNDIRMDKQDVKIHINHNTILKWSGGIAAILTCAGFILTMSKILPVGGG